MAGARRTDPRPERGAPMSREDLGRAALALIGFAMLSLLTALGFSLSTGGVVSETLPPTGGIIGPITVEKDRTVYQITVAQPVPDGRWNHIEGAVLDADKNHLFSFGEEFWAESGYDDEGAWSERKTDYDIKVTLQKGTYYLGFTPENPRIGGGIRITVDQKGGSAVPFVTAGVISLIIGVILNEKAKGTIGRKLQNLDRAY